MKRVLEIVPYAYLPYYSGGQKFIARFLHYLGKETEMTVVSVKENDWDMAETYQSVSLLKPSFRRYLDTSLVKKISTLIEKEKFDTIIWWHPYYWWLAARIQKKTGIKTIVHTHNIEYQRFKSIGKWWWWILKFYEKRCFKRADAIFFVSPEDRTFAITSWNISPEKCIDVPFGIDINSTPADRSAAKKLICSKHKIEQGEKILLFNGLLSYKPNLDALQAILHHINPILSAQQEYRYKLIVCGKGLPAELNNLKEFETSNIIYTGFVDDIDPYFKAADIFLNPVQSGGGIKTKMVEAIGFGTTVVSSKTGAAGIVQEVCGSKLKVVPDNAWELFSQTIIECQHQDPTPASYYDYYYYGNSVKRLIKTLR